MTKSQYIPARIALLGAVVSSAVSLGGCGFSARPQPVAYIAPPPPGEKRCVVYGEDMFGRRYCSKFYGP